MIKSYIKILFKYYIIIFITIILLYIYYCTIRPIHHEGFQAETINKTIWLLWLQGWDYAPWLPQQVKKSWEVKNPGWKVELVTEANLRDYVTDIDYVYRDTISPQAKSDIIRLALLNKHGGVWADATLLCMKPLDSWIQDAIKPSGLWMYHGTGAQMDIKHGPASWFIVSVAGSPIIKKWKAGCDDYWKERKSTGNYFWMDGIFKNLYETDSDFKEEWNRVPYISCEDRGQAHMFTEGLWKENTKEIKQLLDESPPHVVKLWNNRWNDEFPDITSERCKQSNGYYAIEIATSNEE